MKWLAPFLCLWAMSASAQTSQEPVNIDVPIMVSCSDTPAEDVLPRIFGEIPFLDAVGRFQLLDGSVVEGKMQIFVDPQNDRSYTIIVKVNDLNCMLLSGEQIKPSSSEDNRI